MTSLCKLICFETIVYHRDLWYTIFSFMGKWVGDSEPVKK